MPEWAEDDPGAYWEAADEHERANGRLYSEVQFALPKELSEAERREACRRASPNGCAPGSGYPIRWPSTGAGRTEKTPTRT